MSAQKQSLQRSLEAQAKIHTANLEECRRAIKRSEDSGKTMVSCPILGDAYEKLLESEGYLVRPNLQFECDEGTIIYWDEESVSQRDNFKRR